MNQCKWEELRHSETLVVETQRRALRVRRVATVAVTRVAIGLMGASSSSGLTVRSQAPVLEVTKLEQERDHASRVRAAAMEGLSQPELIRR